MRIRAIHDRGRIGANPGHSWQKKGSPVSAYLVTGVAGFIASKVAEFLLAEGHVVIGVDNLNDAYDVRLKQWRLAQLEGKPGFVSSQMIMLPGRQ